MDFCPLPDPHLKRSTALPVAICEALDYLFEDALGVTIATLAAPVSLTATKDYRHRTTLGQVIPQAGCWRVILHPRAKCPVFETTRSNIGLGSLRDVKYLTLTSDLALSGGSTGTTGGSDGQI
jgi:hypothetical protein